MLRVALSTSSSGSSGDENADEQPRCPAPRWRLDPGDAPALEASADLVLAALSRGQTSTDAGAAAAARWTVAEVWAPAGLDALVPRVTPPASPLPPPAASLNFAAAPPPPRRPRAPLELVVCRCRDARRCVRHMRRDLHCCAGCVDDPLAAYVRRTFAAPVRDRDAVQVAAFASGKTLARAEHNWAARAASRPRAAPATPPSAPPSDGRVSPPRRVPGTPPVPTRPPRPPPPARTLEKRGAAAFAARLRWACALPLLNGRGDACGVLVLRFVGEDAPTSTTTARRAVEHLVAAAAAAADPPLFSRVVSVSDGFDEAADDADGIIISDTAHETRPLWEALPGL